VVLPTFHPLGFKLAELAHWLQNDEFFFPNLELRLWFRNITYVNECYYYWDDNGLTLVLI